MNKERLERIKRRKAAAVGVGTASGPALVDGSTGSSVEPPKTLLAFGRHFVCETQSDEEDNIVYAVYRVTDWLESEPGAEEPPPPVHVFELPNDAIVAISVLDNLVDRVDGGEAFAVELPVPTTPATVKPAIDAGETKTEVMQ